MNEFLGDQKNERGSDGVGAPRCAEEREKVSKETGARAQVVFGEWNRGVDLGKDVGVL